MQLLIMQRIEESLAIAIGMTARAIARKVNKVLSEKKFPVTMEQSAMLHILIMKQEGTIQQDIAEEMEKHKSAILRAIDLLEHKKLVERSGDPKDRRKNIVTVTEAGKKVVDEVFLIKENVIQDLIKGVNDQEYEIFVKVLKTIQANAKN